MRYVSIDTETTGTKPDRHQVLEFGAVIEDTNNALPLDQLPTFKRLIKYREIVGQPFAINMNARLFKLLAYPEPDVLSCEPHELAEQFKTFLIDNGFETDDKNRIRVVPAGKNFATFDMLFLERLPNWSEHIRLSHKVIDPAVFFLDFINDTGLPSLEDCKRRAGLEDATVSHDALADAFDVIRVIRSLKRY